MTLVKPRAPFFHGARQYTPADAPFEVDDERARLLLSAGLVEAVARVDASPPAVVPAPVAVAVDPAPAGAERAVSRKRR